MVQFQNVTTVQTVSTVLTKKNMILFTILLLHQCDILWLSSTSNDESLNNETNETNETTNNLNFDTHNHNFISCQGYKSGDTFPCPCSTGMIRTNTNTANTNTSTNTDNTANTNTASNANSEPQFKTIVFNQCKLGIQNGAYHGTDIVHINNKNNEMGMAVYSNHLDLCGGKERQCYCTCFDQHAVDGSVGFRTSISASASADVSISASTTSHEKQLPGYITDCLGLCGPDCEQGKGNTRSKGIRYASIVIHDICQSFIRSIEPMPNDNHCSDEGWSAWKAALLSLVKNGSCPSMKA